MKSSVKADFVMPIVVLMLICLVMSGLLAGTNFITEPIITEGDAIRAEQARIDALPAADGCETWSPCVSAPADLVFDPTLAHWGSRLDASTPSLVALSPAGPYVPCV